MTAVFKTELDVRLLADNSNDGRGTWQLLTDLVYQSDIIGTTLTIPAGFITDFASLPRAPFVFVVFGDRAHKAAVVHDWLYTTHFYTREESDNVFYEAMIASGMHPDIAKMMFEGVRLFGASHWDEQGQLQPDAIKSALLGTSP